MIVFSRKMILILKYNLYIVIMQQNIEPKYIELIFFNMWLQLHVTALDQFSETLDPLWCMY